MPTDIDSGTGTICAISVEGIVRNNSVNFEFGPVVQDMSFKRFLIWSIGGPPVQERNQICNFERGHHGDIHQGG